MPPGARRVLSAGLQGAFLTTFVGLLLAAQRVPREPARGALEDRTAAIARSFERAADDALRVLSPLASQFASEDPPDWRSFARTLRDEPGGLAPEALVAWAPVVPGSIRTEYEERTGRDAYRSFRIAERDARGRPLAARTRPEHLPVHLVNPLAENDELLGFDLGARPELASALDRARTTGEPQAIAPWSFGFGERRDARALVMVPVFSAATQAGPRADRFAGVVLAAVPWEPIVAAAGGGPEGMGGEVTLRLLPMPIDPGAAHADEATPALTTARAVFYVGERPWALEIAVAGRAARLWAKRPR